MVTFAVDFLTKTPYFIMLAEKDLKQIAQKGITKEQIENQLNEFKTGFPFLKLEAAAGIGKGIIAPDAAERKKMADAWNE